MSWHEYGTNISAYAYVCLSVFQRELFQFESYFIFICDCYCILVVFIDSVSICHELILNQFHAMVWMNTVRSYKFTLMFVFYRFQQEASQCRGVLQFERSPGSQRFTVSLNQLVRLYQLTRVYSEEWVFILT